MHHQRYNTIHILLQIVCNYVSLPFYTMNLGQDIAKPNIFYFLHTG